MPTNLDKFMMLSTEEIHKALSVIIEKKIPIQRRKPDGTFAFIPPREFDNYMKSRELSFFIDKDVFNKELSRYYSSDSPDLSADLLEIVSEAGQSNESFEPDKQFECELNVARQMNFSERIDTVRRGNSRLRQMIQDGVKFESASMAKTKKIISDFICVNKATLEDNLQSSVSGDVLTSLVAETRNMVDSLITMIAKGKSSFADLAMLDEINTGSSTIDHMNRIVIRYISFLFFYNSYFQKHSNEVKKFRAYFQKNFYPYYEKLTNGEQSISLEIVFKGGMVPVSDRSVFIDTAIGSFFHDIGKLPMVDYHDGNAGYDPMKARRHVFDSYNMLQKSKTYSWGVVSTGLLHHDYYNHSHGYRQQKTFMNLFPDRRERPRDIAFTRFMMSYNILDVAYDAAYSYFPNKLVELVDIYDSMTDFRKSYRTKPFTPEETLAEIKKYYLEGSGLGVDPILFDIFIDFAKASRMVGDPIYADSLKIG